MIKPQPQNSQPGFSFRVLATWSRTLAVSNLFRVSAHPKRVFLNRKKFPSYKPEAKPNFSLTVAVQRSFRELELRTPRFSLH